MELRPQGEGEHVCLTWRWDVLERLRHHTFLLQLWFYGYFLPLENPSFMCQSLEIISAHRLRPTPPRLAGIGGSFSRI